MEHLFALLKKYMIPDIRPGYLREFHEELHRAISDGKLTEDEIERLESIKEEHGLSDDALSAVRQELYTQAFLHMKEREDVSEAEWDEMEHIQDYLGLSDEDIAPTKRELYRMRILSEIKQGSLPVIEDDRIVLDPQEILHWREPVRYAQAASKKTAKSLNVQKDDIQDTGTIFITSKRIMFSGKETTFSQRFLSISGMEYYVNGCIVRIESKKPLVFEYTEKGNHNVVGSILAAALEIQRNA